MKQILKKCIYKCYKKVQNNVVMVNVINYMYIYVFPYFRNEVRKNKRLEGNIKLERYNKRILKDIRDLKIAVICDEMTFRCLCNECEVVFLTPYDWKAKLNEFKPDFLFCESAWSGINEFQDCWRGRIYKNNMLKFENRKELFKILKYCREANIKTVFWNKEDPTFFEHKIYNFTDTALHFDYIFTTAKECVEKYKSMGHNNVDVLMFGFSPKIFNPIGSIHKEDMCIFAGSWYSDQPQRCEDMNKILNFVLKENLKLVIYDRNYNSGNPVNEFPERFKPFIKGTVDFTELNLIIKRACFAVNVNTVTSSETMFARRIFETMACNTCIISNYSLGMERLFGDNVWFVNKEFDKSLIKEKCKRNVDIVFKNHTYKNRLKKIIDVLNIQCEFLKDRIKVIYENNDIEKCRKHFNTLDYEYKDGYMLSDGYIISINNGCNLDFNALSFNNDGYFVIININTIDNFDLGTALQHFSYIGENTGIRRGNSCYEFVTDNDNINTLFNIKMIKRMLNDINIETEKYII